MLLYRALDWAPPTFAHVALVTGPDGPPLAKSRGSLAIRELRARGYLPEAIVNHLALLGWSDPEGREVLDVSELIAAFDISRFSRSPARHDPERLRWLNARHLRRLDAAGLSGRIRPFLPDTGRIDPERLVAAIADDLVTLEDARRLAAPIISPSRADAVAVAALTGDIGRHALEIARDAFEAAGTSGGEDLFSLLKEALSAAGISPRRGLPVLRAALTGSMDGLPVADIFGLLGPKESLERIEAALHGDLG